MSKNITAVFTLMLFLSIAGCDTIDAINAAPGLEARIKTLEENEQTLKELLEANTSSLNRLENVFPQTAFIQPTSKGYSVAACSSGYFTLSCENIKEYGTGSEVTLEVVNLLGVTTTGVTLYVRYYPATPDEGKSLYDSVKSIKEEIARIDSGKAVYTTLRLPEYKPDNLSALLIEIGVKGTSYIRQ